MRELVFTQPTWLKKNSVKQASELLDHQKFRLVVSNEKIYKAVAYKDLTSHFTISFDQPIGPYNTWNVFRSHFQWRDEILLDYDSNSKTKVLKDFPYYSQIDNKQNPYGSCNVTSISMCLSYFGLKPKNSWQQFEDELYLYMSHNGLSRHSPYDLQYVANLYGKKYNVQDRFTERATLEDIKKSIDKGFPCVVHGFFTSFGHIICIVGYSPEGFIVMDPYGEYWSSGYDVNDWSSPNKGKLLTYSYGMISKLCSPEGPGHIFTHFIERIRS